MTPPADANSRIVTEVLIDKMGITRINWETGTWERPHGEKPAAEIIIAGDWAPIRDFSDRILHSPKAIYGDLLPVLRDSQLRLVNLECPLVDDGISVHKSGATLKGVSGHIKGLTTVPFDVATLGNNHIFDYGTEAFVQTRALLNQNGIQSTGAGHSLAEAERPLIVAVKGIQIGIISFSEGEDLTAAGHESPGVLGWEIDRVMAKIKQIRSDVHVVIVICHGGVEYIPFPPPYLADALKRIAEAGADLVIGHHPHVPRVFRSIKAFPSATALEILFFSSPPICCIEKLATWLKPSWVRAV